MSVDWIAFGALALSVISLGWQIVDRVRQRPRLVVSLTTGGTNEEREGELWSVHFVTVTAHAVSGRIGIRSIAFELDPLPSQGYATVPYSPLGMTPSIDLHRDHPALENGDTASWSYRFQDNMGQPFADRLMITAVVTLVNDKVVSSEPVSLGPDFKQKDYAQLLAMLSELRDTQDPEAATRAIAAIEDLKGRLFGESE